MSLPCAAECARRLAARMCCAFAVVAGNFFEEKEMKLSPLAEVKEKFGSRDALVKLVMSKIERPEGMSDEKFEEKVRTVSNRKLLKLNAAHDDMIARFGSKEGLVDAIMAIVTTGKVDVLYRAKLMTLRPAQLLDLHKSLVKKS